jgi:hypothetical protein
VAKDGSRASGHGVASGLGKACHISNNMAWKRHVEHTGAWLENSPMFPVADAQIHADEGTTTLHVTNTNNGTFFSLPPLFFSYFFSL